MSRSVVVVGASMAGLRVAEQLRSAGWEGKIVVVGEELHMPYSRPPLSKEALGLPDDATLEDWHSQTAFRLKRTTADVEWLLGAPAVTADVVGQTIDLADGRRLRYDGLVVATGLRPRRLPLDGGETRRFVIRTIDDARALRKQLRPGTRVGVVGGGFIGCEVAVALAAAGHHVTVIEPLGTIMERAIGSDVGESIQRHHAGIGVTFLTGTGLESLKETVDGLALELSDGSTVEVDLVVESVGARPNVEWLEGSDLDLSDGVLTDNHMQTEGHPEIVAVGDVARFPNPRLGPSPRRVEHWCVPTDTAKRAARSLVAHLTDGLQPSDEFAPLLWFWSDQGDLRLQSFGSPALADSHRLVEGDLDDPSDGLAVEYFLGDRLIGVLLINIPPARHTDYRERVDHSYTPAPLIEGALP